MIIWFYICFVKLTNLFKTHLPVGQKFVVMLSDAWSLVFREADVKSLAMCSSVCKSWHDFAVTLSSQPKWF